MRNRTDIKNTIAIVVISASFLLAIGLAFVANNRSSYWVASKDLTPGHIIESTDFYEVKGAFGKEVNGYISTDQSLVDLTITRFIAAGEYLNQSGLAKDTGESNTKLLSFAVATPDLPSSVRIGDTVDLYQVINDSGDGKSIPSRLVIEAVYVVDLNRKNENLGGLSIVTVAIPVNFVELTLDSTRRGRMVVVINHG